MLNSLSWTDFVLVMAALIGGYWAIIALLRFLKKFSYHYSSKPTYQIICAESSSHMMGAIKPDVKVNRHGLVSPNQITIAPDEVLLDPMELDVHVGPSVSDLLQEIKALTKQIQNDDVRESESLPMYKTLIQKNTHLASSPYKEVINKFLHDHCTNVCGFQIEISEIRLWWSNN